MPWKKHTAAEIARKLAAVRQATRSGCSLSDAICSVGVSQATYFRWQVAYGDLDVAQVQQVMRAQAEVSRLRRALAEITAET